MLISIITIVKNDQCGLNQTLNSVVEEFPNQQHIIVDGSHPSLDISKTINNSKIIYSKNDLGISHAFNRGILNADGDYIIFLNAGDTFLTGAGGHVENSLQDFSFDCFWFSVIRESKNKKTLFKPRLKYLYYAMSCPHQGMIIKKDIFSKIGLFPLQKYSMDHYLALKLLKTEPKIKVDNNAIAIYPSGGHSTLGGAKPFLYNIVNVIRIDPKRLFLAIILNTYLGLKSIILK